MTNDLIRVALGTATDTKAVVVERHALAQTPKMFKSIFGNATAIVVGDERTMAVAGNQVVQALRDAGVPMLEPHVFPGEPELYAKYENIAALRDVLARNETCAIAVGAGTLNDIVKRASGELDRGYMVVCTAASMDGYTAFGSSIAVDGFKQTLNCPAPQGCIADLDVLSSAPQSMTASGFGDLIGKVPAGADWIIADFVGAEALHPVAWNLVQGPLAQSIARPAELAKGDPDAVRELGEGLLMSGLAMQAYQSSRPASGAEHQFSHLWEMEGLGVDVIPRRLSHGFKVGIGSIAVCALYEVLLQRDVSHLDVEGAMTAWLSRQDAEARVREYSRSDRIAGEMVNQAMAKWITPDQLRTRLESVKAGWGELSTKLRAQLMPAMEVQQRLKTVGAPSHPYDIGLDWDRFRETYLRAQMIRSRYTVLDLVWEMNLLEGIVDELFDSPGFWGKQA